MRSWLGRPSSTASRIHLHCEGPGPHLAPEMAGHFRHRALFIGPNARAAVNEGRADYIPVFLSDIPGLFGTGQLPWTRCWSTRPARRARVLLARHGPWKSCTRPSAPQDGHRPAQQRDAAHARRELHPRDEIDLAVEVDVPPYEHPRSGRRRRGADRPVRRRPGARWRDLQLGIGAIPAVTHALRDKRDLGIHSEMFTDAVVDLVESGVVTGARKELNRGKIVTAFLMGSQRLYDFVARQPDGRDAIGGLHQRHPVIRRAAHDRHQLRDRGRRHRPGRRGLDRAPVLQRHRRPDGFVRGASLTHRSGHHRAAVHSRRGHSVPDLSTLRAGAGVVTTRAHVRTVVTEWASPSSTEKHPRARKALIAIADPTSATSYRSRPRQRRAVSIAISRPGAWVGRTAVGSPSEDAMTDTGTTDARGPRPARRRRAPAHRRLVARRELSIGGPDLPARQPAAA